MTKLRVKNFWAYRADDLENQINNWLEQHNIQAEDVVRMHFLHFPWSKAYDSSEEAYVEYLVKEGRS